MSSDNKTSSPAVFTPATVASALPELLPGPCENYAFFLDIDGTLLDLAPSPDEIVVPADLPGVLNRLSRKMSGALALVTGRSLSCAGGLFQPFQFPIAGLHGAERRDPDGTVHRARSSTGFEMLKLRLSAELEGWKGVYFEDKGAAVAAHYRGAPEREEEVRSLMQRTLDGAGDGWTLQHGKMVVEIRPAGCDKGEAALSFMQQAPFKGRIPVAIGDDLTDEAMFRFVNNQGGLSIRVGSLSSATEAQRAIPSPADLRHALAALCA